MALDETVSSFIERYSPTAEPAGCFVFHGCIIHLVLHRQILNGVEYDEPVAAAIEWRETEPLSLKSNSPSEWNKLSADEALRKSSVRFVSPPA